MLSKSTCSNCDRIYGGISPPSWYRQMHEEIIICHLDFSKSSCVEQSNMRTVKEFGDKKNCIPCTVAYLVILYSGGPVQFLLLMNIHEQVCSTAPVLDILYWLQYSVCHPIGFQVLLFCVCFQPLGKTEVVVHQ